MSSIATVTNFLVPDEALDVVLAHSTIFCKVLDSAEMFLRTRQAPYILKDVLPLFMKAVPCYQEALAELALHQVILMQIATVQTLREPKEHLDIWERRLLRGQV